MDARDLAATIGVRFVAAMPVGESGGAYEVTTAVGDRAVLKIESALVADLAITHALTDALRARGCPVPERLGDGVVGGTHYELFELLPGTSSETVTPALLADVPRVHELLYDLGRPGRAPWVEDMVTSVTEGRSGYCEHAPLRAHDPHLLDRLRSISSRSRSTHKTTRSARHCSTAPGRGPIRERCSNAAHMVLRQVDWSPGSIATSCSGSPTAGWPCPPRSVLGKVVT